MTDSSAADRSWSGRWYSFLDGLGYDLRRGRSLARRMRVQSVDVQFGRIVAEVEDRERVVCTVEIEIVLLRDEEWSSVLDALAGEALHAAQLLAGGTQWETVRSVLDTVFAGASVSLLPAAGAADVIIARCDFCESQGRPCRHALVALYLFGQMITDDPWLLMRLRGQDRQQLLAGLRRRRSDGVPGRADPKGGTSAALSAPTIPGGQPMRATGSTTGSQGEELPLAAQIDTFWGRRPLWGQEGTPQDLRALHYNFSPPLIRLALLRRLGPPPFPQDSLDIYERLASIYLHVSEKALELAFTPEPDGDSAR